MHERTMPKVFCIGMFKTGTTTTGAALERLGFRTFHGPFWGIGNDPFDFDVSEFEKRAALLQPVLDSHDAFEDYPFMFIYRFLFATYPDARFILTERAAIDVARSDREMWLYGNMSEDEIPSEAAFIKRYERHNRDVLDFFGDSGRLLRVQVEETPDHRRLCEFLGFDGNDCGPWPHRNIGAYRARGPLAVTRRIARKLLGRRHIFVKPPSSS